MASVAILPARLPPRPKLRSALKSTTDVKVLQVFLETVAQQPKGKENGLRILLQTSAEVGNGRFAEVLLAEGAKVDAESDSSLPPLYYAVEGGHVATVSLLLAHGAAVVGTDKSQRSLIMYAALSGNVEVMEMLLDKGADFGGKDRQGRSAVMHAVSAGHAEALKLLLRRGADVKGADEAGKTPLMYAASKGNLEVLRILLGNSAEIQGTDNERRSALLHAMSGGHLQCVSLLLDRGADIKSTGESGRCLKQAAMAGQNDILELLIKYKANVNAVDDDWRSPLLNLAADTSKTPKWNKKTVSLLLSANANVEKFDRLRRTALQWAAVNGHVEFAQLLLNSLPPDRTSKTIGTTERRGKTALHLAAQHNRPELVRLLLNHGANIEAVSEGHWTPLLNAAKAGHVAVVDALLSSSVRANVNARTSSGMTALHWAAENGRTDVVRRILKEDKAWKNSKDSFHTTPLVRAGQHGHFEIIDALKPHIFGGSLSQHAKDACENFTASIVDFFVKHGTLERNEVRKRTVWDTLYAPDPNEKSKFAITTNLQDMRRGTPDFRWIHLPANNLAWSEALITKMFLEGGATDIIGFKAMLRVFGQQQHRGSKVHSRFMRPACQHIAGDALKSVSTETKSQEAGSIAGGPQAITIRAATPTSPTTINSPAPPATATGGVASTKSKSHRHQKSVAMVFMPYLHWETDQNRMKTRETVAEVLEADALSTAARRGRDESLIRGYLHHSTDLHLRRTLDQYKYHSVNTDKRDRDQVVYRYCQRYRDKFSDPKIFMVDQMWIWVFDDIVLTCFPERWGQPIRDPLNLFDGLVEDINSKTQPPVKSVEELAALITNRCTGSFDRHEWGYDDFLFFEMFELSIGTLTRRETKLFEQFQRDSGAAAAWLKHHDRPHHKRFQSSKTVLDAEDRENEEDEWLYEDDGTTEHSSTEPDPEFVQRLLNISKEAQLLVECKDIEDELSILTAVLQQQNIVLQDMGRVFKAFSTAHGGKKSDVAKKCAQQKRVVDLHLLDIERMSNQAKSVNRSLTQVLDLKQKHANALEARFARNQAQETARQGQTIMVFTIVTIVFLPMSFMAAFFAINIIEFPHDSSNGGNGLHFGYVAKYMFGIGLGVSVPLIAIAFVFGDIRGWIWTAKNWLRGPKSKRSPPAPSQSQIQAMKLKKLRESSEDSDRIYRRPTRIYTDATNGTVDSDLEAAQTRSNRPSTSNRY